MTTVYLRLRTDDDRIEPVELDRLTGRARALAEILAGTPLKAQTAILLESARTVREMDQDADPLWWTAEQLDSPHRVVWEHWAHYPPDSGVDPHDYLEREARKLPLGYYPVGLDFTQRVPSADAARNETDLIPKPRVLELLHALGRPISPATMDNYRSPRFAPKGWPQPVTYVGRTPLWSAAEVRQYATQS